MQPNYILKPGHITVGKETGAGMILVTDTSIFLLKAQTDATMTGGALGGLVGALIGQALDARRAKKSPPSHIQDPEIVALGEKTLRKLMVTKRLAKLPLKSTRIEMTRLGFKFTGADASSGAFSGWFHKRALLNFFQSRNVVVTTA